MFLRTKGMIRSLSGEELYQFFLDNSTKKGNLKEEIQVFRGSSVSFEKKDDDAFHFTFSTDDIDSYGDVIEQEGWVLDRYEKNNVILWAHNHSIPAIGYAKDMQKAPVLNGNIKFSPPEVDDFGSKIQRLISFGAIKAGSVGFFPLEYETIEHRDGGHTIIDGYRFKKQELFEFSICNVPANPFALVDFATDAPKTKQLKPLSGFQFFLPGKE